MRWKTKWSQFTKPFRRLGSRRHTVLSAPAAEDISLDPDAGLQQFFLTTGSYCYEQVSVLGKALGTTLSDPKLQTIAMKLLRMGCIDFVLLVGLRYLNYQTQKIGNEYLRTTPEADEVSVQLVMQAINVVVGLLALRKEIKMALGIAVVILETSDALNNPLNTINDSPCVQERCSILRYIKGSFRGIIGYEATAFAIYLLKFWPYGGEALSSGMKIYNDARYALTVTLELQGICNRHQEEYLAQYPEVTLSFAMMHLALITMTASLLQTVTGIPRALYQTGLQSFFVIAQINVAAQMNLPTAVVKASRRSFDPIVHFTRLIGLIFDTFLLGLKKQMPHLIKRHGEMIHWDELGAKALSVWTHPITRGVKWVTLPRMLQNQQALIDDPLIPWESIREKMIASLQRLKSHIDSWPVQAVSNYPKLVAHTVPLLGFGIPPACTELVLKIMGNPEFKHGLNAVLFKLNYTHRTHPVASHITHNREVYVQPERLMREEDELEGLEDKEEDETLLLSAPLNKENDVSRLDAQFNPHSLIKSSQNQLFTFFSGIRTSPGANPPPKSNRVFDIHQLPAFTGTESSLSGNSHKSEMKH
ncbi:MAG: hypothetical protein H2069_00545 [Legionella sp.]|nr:hypothetical protein [Legionella sp.]